MKTPSSTEQRDRMKPLLPVLPALLLPSSGATPRAYMEKKLLLAGPVGVGSQRPWTRAWRAAKTLFFLLAMLASLLVSSARPLLVALLDVAFPCAFLVLLGSDNGGGAPPPLSVGEQLRAFDFRYSLVDLPLVSAARSLLILGAYGLCDGPGRSRGPYLASALLCSTASAAYVWAKASVFGGRGWLQLLHAPGTFSRASSSAAAAAAVAVVEGQPVAPESLAVVEALLLGSVVLAAAHAVVAYRTSCRERRKMLVYRIDLEAVSAACKSGALDYHHLNYSK